MFPLFFANKPVERLTDPGIRADGLNDDVPGGCLDTLFEMGQALSLKTNINLLFE